MPVDLAKMMEKLESAKISSAELKALNKEIKMYVKSADRYLDGDEEFLKQISNHLGKFIRNAIAQNDAKSISALINIVPDLLKAGIDPSTKLFTSLFLEQVQEALEERIDFEPKNIQNALRKVNTLMKAGYNSEALTVLNEAMRNNPSSQLQSIRGLLAKVVTSPEYNQANEVQFFTRKLPNFLLIRKNIFQNFSKEYENSANKEVSKKFAYNLVDELNDFATYHPDEFVRNQALITLKDLPNFNPPSFIVDRVKESSAVKAKSASSAPGRLEHTDDETAAIGPDEAIDELVRWSHILERDPKDVLSLKSVDIYIKVLQDKAFPVLKELSKEGAFPRVITEKMEKAVAAKENKVKAQEPEVKPQRREWLASQQSKANKAEVIPLKMGQRGTQNKGEPDVASTKSKDKPHKP